ncbi:MAG: hypothetical protein HY843_02500 [Bdellovibrio sp.]|nr:hypothetical protein [Bdellovibrio sp.]
MTKPKLKSKQKPKSKIKTKAVSKLGAIKKFLLGSTSEKKSRSDVKKAHKETANLSPPNPSASPSASPSANSAAGPSRVKTSKISVSSPKTEPVHNVPALVTGVKTHGKKTSSAAPKLIAVSRTSRNAVVCREVACEGLATTGGYCRLHYIKNWKKIKRKEVILKEKKLNRYIEELVVKYPDKYIEAIRQDLASDKDFSKVISDLDLDEAINEFDIETETPETLIDHIKRDFEDEGDY